MESKVDYSKAERFWLWLLAVVGFVGLNGAFAYGLIYRPDSVSQAMANPVSLAFVIEAMIMMAALAYLLSKWGVSRLSWWWFIALSLLGSMAFALPVVLLWPRRGA
jgi:hypothetical protein